jgi:hypothetical protein
MADGRWPVADLSSPPPECQKWYWSGYIGNKAMFMGFFEIPVTVTGYIVTDRPQGVTVGDQPGRKPRNTPRTRKEQGTQRGRAATKNNLTADGRLHGWNSWKNWLRSSGQSEERLAQQATEPKFSQKLTKATKKAKKRRGSANHRGHRVPSAAEPPPKMI